MNIKENEHLKRNKMNDLAKRVVACKGWEWLPGIAVYIKNSELETVTSRVTGTIVPNSGGLRVITNQRWCKPTEVTPILEDPATTGVLLQLCRDAGDEPSLHVRFEGGGWVVHTGLDFHGESEATEIGAMVCYLESCDDDQRGH